MDAIVPRLHLFEIDDQPWFPGFLRARVQAVLTGFWNTRIPPVQPLKPATLIANMYSDVLGKERLRQYTVVDFCAGAGGPMPAIERSLNQQLQSSSSPSSSTSSSADDADTAAIDFVLTDIAPHNEAWRRAAAASTHVHFVPTPVDAAAAPRNLLAKAGLRDGRVLRTFHLSFHHFDDDAAVRILRNTFETADAIAIVELVERSFSSLLLNLLLVVPIAVFTPFLYWDDPTHLFFTFVVPVIPFVTMFDGLVSSLRVRRHDEVLKLVGKAQVNGELENWEWRWGRQWHTWPLGVMSYVVGWKKEQTEIS